MATNYKCMFKIAEFVPVLTKRTIYADNFCLYCRGDLNDYCPTCIVDKIAICDVKETDEKGVKKTYHLHCYIKYHTKETEQDSKDKQTIQQVPNNQIVDVEPIDDTDEED